MSSSQDDSLKRIFRFLPYLLALIGLGMFLYTLFGDDEPPMQSIYWFLLVVAAFFLPYIKEITFQDIKLKLEEGLEKQQAALEDTREELEAAIKAFQEKLGMVPDGIFGHNSYKKLVAYVGGGEA